jgi:hypothetical protein
MAQPIIFTSVGGIQTVKGRGYTVSDLPTVTPTAINTVVVNEAPLLWRKKLNEDGTTVKNEDGTDKYVETNQRGVHIYIVRTGVTYGTGVNKNVPVIYKEGDEIALDSGDTYTFLESCTIEFGIK